MSKRINTNQPPITTTATKVRARARPTVRKTARTDPPTAPLPASPPLLLVDQDTTTETDHSTVETLIVNYEDVLHVPDIVTEIVSHLPVRQRWRLALLDKGTYRAYQSRYTHQYKVEGCGVELYFAPHMVEIKAPEEASQPSNDPTKVRMVTSHRTMHKVDLVRELLSCDTPVASLLAPTSYGKTLMAAIIAFQYRGERSRGSRGVTYRLGDEVAPEDRAWLLVPKKCIENQLAELEKAYPGCIQWEDPYHSPVVVMDYAISLKVIGSTEKRDKAMYTYASERLPDFIVGPYSSTDDIVVSQWLDARSRRYDDGPSRLSQPLSPHNKVIVLSHSAIRRCGLTGAHGLPPPDMVWQPARSGLIIVDEAQLRTTAVQQVVGVPSARSKGRALLLSATKHVNVEASMEARGLVSYYEVAANTIADEKPLYTIHSQYYPSTESILDSLRELVRGGTATRIVVANYRSGGGYTGSYTTYELWEVIAKVFAGPELVPEPKKRTKKVTTTRAEAIVTLGNNQGKTLARTLEQFNQPDEVDGGLPRILVADVCAIGVGLNIHADHVLILTHDVYDTFKWEANHSRPPTFISHYSMSAGPTYDRSYYARIISPSTLHQLVGRFVRIHNRNESIPITLIYNGPYRVAPSAQIVDELAIRALIAAFRLRQDAGAKNMILGNLDDKCLALALIVPNALEWDDLTILFHLYPGTSGVAAAYKGLPCYSTPRQKWLTKYMSDASKWVHLYHTTHVAGYDAAAPLYRHPHGWYTIEDCTFHQYNLRIWPDTYVDDNTAGRVRYRYIRDERTGLYREPTTTGEECKAVVDYVALSKREYEALVAGSAGEPKRKGRGKK